MSFTENLKQGNVWQYPYTMCDEDNLIAYLNAKDVRKAFHVNNKWHARMTSDPKWDVCSWIIQYDVNYTDDAQNQVPWHRYNMQNGVRTLIYSGNTDLVVAYTATRYWIYDPSEGNLGNDSDPKNAQSKGTLLSDWHSWHVNGGQVAGWMQEWQQLVFAVVRDAGHEVPEYQPLRALSLFKRFIADNYSDDFESNQFIDLSAVTEKNFNTYETTNSDKNSAFWKGFEVGIAVVVGVILVVLAAFYCKYRAQFKSGRRFGTHQRLPDSD